MTEQTDERPLRVLFMLPRFHTNIASGISALIDQGIAVSLLVDDVFPYLEDHTAIKPIHCGADGFDVDRMLEHIADFKPDVAIIRHFKQKDFPRSALPFMREMGVKIFAYSQHSVDQDAFQSNMNSFGSRAKYLWRVSPVKNRFDKTARGKNSMYLPLPVVGESTPMPNMPPLRILCVAKVDVERKNHGILLEAFERVSADHDVELTLVGGKRESPDGRNSRYFTQLEESLKKSPYSKRISLHTNIPYNKMAEYYKSHHVCILPSRTEPLGTSPLEAMAFGRVAIISDEAGSAGEIDQGVNGFVVGVDNSDDIVAVLQSLLADPDQIVRVSKAAADYCERNLSPNAFVNAIRALAAVQDEGDSGT